MANGQSTAPGPAAADGPGSAEQPGTITASPFAAGWRGSRGLFVGSFRVLVVGQATGQLADGLAQIAFAQLVLFDIGRGATPAGIATVLAVTLLPFSVVGPVAGVFIDRWNRRRTLVIGSWLRAALALIGVAAALAHSEAAAYAGVLLMLSSSRFVLDAKGAVLPRTVAPQDLVRANAISGLLGMSATFLGAVGGSLFVSASVSAGFVAAGASYLAAGLTFRALPFEGGGDRKRRVIAAITEVIRQLRAGVRVTAATADLRRPLVTVWAHRLLLGGGFILLVLVADHRYHLSAPGYGLAVAVTGVSAFAGTVCAPWLVARWHPDVLLPLAFLPPAGAAIFVGYSPTLLGLLGALAVTAVSFQCLKVLADALVGRAAPDALRGRVFAIYDVLYNLAFVLAGLAMVPLWHADRERALLWWLGTAFAVGWLACARMLRRWPFAVKLRPPGRRARLVRLNAAAALACGALPVLAFPKPELWWLAWVALVPWLVLIRRAASARAAGLVGWCGGFGFLFTLHYWLLPTTTVLLPLAVGLLAVLWVPWAMLAWRLFAQPQEGRRLVAGLVVIPAGWVIVETVRSWSALGGPWGLLGASQWDSPAFLAPASLGGVWLVGFLIVAANVAVLNVALARTWRLRGATAALTVAALLAGPVWYLAEPKPRPAGTAAIAVVQAGVVHDPTTRLNSEIAATAQLPFGKFQLVVWGESSVGFDLFNRPDLVLQLRALSSKVGAALLVNVDAASPSGAIRKTAVLIWPAGIEASYSKMRLVPFGEYIPLRPLLGWLSAVTKAAARNRIRGTHIVVMHAGGLTFAPLTCFESAFPDMSRTATRGGAELLIFQTATTTFQGSWAPDQHAALAAVRAAGTGRPTVQASLSGTTAAFDARGQRIIWSPAATGTAILTVPRATVSTAYDRLGDWVPAWSYVIVVLGLIAISLAPQADQRPRTSPVAQPAAAAV